MKLLDRNRKRDYSKKHRFDIPAGNGASRCQCGLKRIRGYSREVSYHNVITGEAGWHECTRIS